MERIVVGVDGSAASRAALRWAVREALLRDASVDAVTAWHYPYAATAEGFGRGIPLSAWPEPEVGARQTLDDAVQAIAGEFERLPIIERVVVLDGAAHALLENAKGADLLVVGSRGHGGFVGLLLGSVSSHCAAHAPCPVAIIRS